MDNLLKIKNLETKFKITNKNETKAEIVIYSDIGASFWGDGVTAKSFSDELKSLPKSITDIEVRINSGGGDVFDGITIYNRLKQHSAKIKVYIDGLAASIASIIALAGDEVVMGEGALMMIHKPMTFGYGNSIEFEELISRLDDVEEQLIGIYKRKTGLDRSEIKTLLAEETWLDADEALEKGFVDEIMESEEEVQIAAYTSNCPWIKNKNFNFVSGKTYVKKQIEKFKQDAEALLTR